MSLVYVITLVLLCIYGLLLAYYHRSFCQLQANEEVPPSFQPQTRITVLVPARNEERNIRACIDAILAQEYPAELLECIIIDDHSEDSTAAMVHAYSDPGLRLISLQTVLPEGAVNSYKKKAIEAGVAAANGELIVTTDADCLVPPAWLRTIAHTYEKAQPCLVAGPVRMSAGKGWLPAFQALDFLSLQGITAASVYKGFHSMCNGANLAYTKKAFHSVDGYQGIDHLASGDDMLLMHKIAQQFPGKISYLKHRNAIVNTEPAPTLKAFLKQRIRWASKAQAYDDKSVFRVLLLVYILNLILLLQIFIAPFSAAQLKWTILFIGIKTLVEWPFMYSVAAFYDQRSLMRWFPLFQPLHILYTVVAGSFGQFGTYVWKGRQVK